jgi:hypothetical protein
MIILVEIIALLLLIFMIIAYLVMNLTTYIQQSRCKHDGGVNETRSCDAICKLCGKDLGFIGTEANKIRRGQ